MPDTTKLIAEVEVTGAELSAQQLQAVATAQD
jgi:hypothetical protein